MVERQVDPRDEIERLIRGAYDAPPPPGNFVDALEKRLQERTGRVTPPPQTFPLPSAALRLMAAAAVIALIVGTVLWLRSTPSGEPQGNSVAIDPQRAATEVAALQVQVEQLDREADSRLRVARLMMTREQKYRRAAEVQAILLRPDPLERIARETDRSARTLVSQADRMYRRLDLKDSAIATYRDVERLFPASPWAAVAKQRLAEIETG